MPLSNQRKSKHQAALGVGWLMIGFWIVFAISIWVGIAMMILGVVYIAWIAPRIRNAKPRVGDSSAPGAL